MKNSQIAIIIAIAILIGYSLVRLGNSSTYSSFEDAIALNGEKTTVIGFLDLEGSMDLSDVEDLEGSVESSLEISSPIDDFTLKAPLRDLIKISCLR